MQYLFERTYYHMLLEAQRPGWICLILGSSVSMATISIPFQPGNIGIDLVDMLTETFYETYVKYIKTAHLMVKE